ncbi:hypothetical protein O9992_25620 [Vibrio lentus]|nr:hypothetical protein [Vibrio lentus]
MICKSIHQKVTDIRSILALSEQINRQHHLGAPMVFAPPSRKPWRQRKYWLGLMIDHSVPSLLRFERTGR